MEREYFDAKFDGLEKLMQAHKENTDGRITGVSNSVKQVARDLADHKENGDAHGQGTREKYGSGIVAWLGFASGAVAVGIALWKHG